MPSEAGSYREVMQDILQGTGTDGKNIVLKEEKLTQAESREKNVVNGILTGGIVLIIFAGVIFLLKRKK